MALVRAWAEKYFPDASPAMILEAVSLAGSNPKAVEEYTGARWNPEDIPMFPYRESQRQSRSRENWVKNKAFPTLLQELAQVYPEVTVPSADQLREAFMARR